MAPPSRHRLHGVFLCAAAGAMQLCPRETPRRRNGVGAHSGGTELRVAIPGYSHLLRMKKVGHDPGSLRDDEVRAVTADAPAAALTAESGAGPDPAP